MNEEQARAIIDPVDDPHSEPVIQPDNALFCLGWYLAWTHDTNPEKATLDGDFSADELEAIAWWMRNKAPCSPTAEATDLKSVQCSFDSNHGE